MEAPDLMCLQEAGKPKRSIRGYTLHRNTNQTGTAILARRDIEVNTETIPEIPHRIATVWPIKRGR